jgi:hypothetical protein
MRLDVMDQQHNAHHRIAKKVLIVEDNDLNICLRPTATSRCRPKMEWKRFAWRGSIDPT